jgi:hypothetical protein
MELGEEADVTMQDYAEKYATETNFKTIQNTAPHVELYRTTSVPKIHTLIETS